MIILLGWDIHTYIHHVIQIISNYIPMMTLLLKNKTSRIKDADEKMEDH